MITFRLRDITAMVDVTDTSAMCVLSDTTYRATLEQGSVIQEPRYYGYGDEYYGYDGSYYGYWQNVRCF